MRIYPQILKEEIIMKCPVCLGEVTSEMKICPVCGANMEKKTEEPALVETSADSKSAKKSVNLLGYISLLSGISSFVLPYVCCFVPELWLIMLSVVAVVAGIIGIVVSKKAGTVNVLAIIGIILGAIYLLNMLLSFLLWCVFMVLYIVYIAFLSIMLI